jgi:cold shock CspA family protein/uncharacterized LabA/DUF88 family protein
MEKIGVFYDGNYFHHVSNYYYYTHEKRRRLSVSGLHNYLRQTIAASNDLPVSMCQIVDAHYFRGRSTAYEASQRGNQLYYDRLFDDILTHEGVTTHYLPMRNAFGRREDKGVDITLALEVYSQAVAGKYSTVALIISDGEYVPLVRKLNALGVKVMVISWDFDYVNHEGIKKQTRASYELMERSNYPIRMHEVIESGDAENVFVSFEHRQRMDDEFIEWDSDSDDESPNFSGPNAFSEEVEDNPKHLNAIEGDELESEILSLKDGFGFIRFPNNNLFFHYTDVENCEFSELQPGEKVKFILSNGNGGQEVAKRVRKINLKNW